MLNRKVFLVLAAILLNLLSAHAQLVVDERVAEGQPPIVMAHRSAVMGGHPENSLAWIKYAIDRGVDMVHINPQLTRDDQYILMHDHTLNRTTNVESVFPKGPPNGPTREQRGGKDYVRDYTLDDIKRLMLVNGQDGATHAVPTLVEALELVDGQLLVVLGLKSYEVESLAKALEGQKKQNLLLWELYFSGTDQTKLRDASTATDLGVAVALFRTRDYMAALEDLLDQLGPALQMISASSKYLTPEFIAKMQQQGLHLMISGWNGAEDQELMNGTDGSAWITLLDKGFAASTDQPDRVLKLLGR